MFRFPHLARALALSGAALSALGTEVAAQATYLESNGIVVIQMESLPFVDDWVQSTATPGSTGAGYIVWTGANYFPAPGPGVFDLRVEIQNPGTYVLNLRNRHENPDPTQENDVWLRLNNGPFEKIFSNGVDSVANWTWEARLEDPLLGFPQQAYVLSAGLHTFTFAARSHGFKMDRLHLAFPGHPQAFNLGLPESTRRIGVEYGNANNNSTGQPGRIEAFGAARASENNLTLHSYALPTGSLGFFIVGNQQIFGPNPGGSAGNVLVGPAIGRYGGNILQANGNGRVQMPVNLTQLPRPTGPVAVTAGQTWYFQYWHRDSNGGAPTSNFSRALAVTFE